MATRLDQSPFEWSQERLWQEYNLEREAHQRLYRRIQDVPEKMTERLQDPLYVFMGPAALAAEVIREHTGVNVR